MVNREIRKRLVTRMSRTLNFTSGWPGFVAILIVGAMVVASVTSRYVFNRPLHFVDEYSGYLMVAIIYFPLAWILSRTGHIRLPFVVTALPRRVANYLEMATILVSLGVIIVLTISVTQLAMDSFARDIRALTFMATPLGPVQLILPIGLGLFAIRIMVEIVQRIKAWGTPPERTTND